MLYVKNGNNEIHVVFPIVDKIHILNCIRDIQIDLPSFKIEENFSKRRLNDNGDQVLVISSMVINNQMLGEILKMKFESDY